MQLKCMVIYKTTRGGTHTHSH